MRTVLHIAILAAANLLLLSGAVGVEEETLVLAKLKKSDAYAANSAYAREDGSRSEQSFHGEGPRLSRTSVQSPEQPSPGVERKAAPQRLNGKRIREKGRSYPLTYRPSLDLRYDD